MAQVISVLNQKGGVGKTSTALALLSGLHRRGKKTLGIDFDPQCNFTYTTGTAGSFTVLNALQGMKAANCIQETEHGSFIAGSEDLTAYTGKPEALKEVIKPLLSQFEYIVIDTPPTLGQLTIMSLCACNGVVIPTQADIYSLQGIVNLTKTLKTVTDTVNKDLQIYGILFTRYNARAVITKDLTDSLQEYADTAGLKVYQTRIRESVSIREAQTVKKSIFDYPRTNGAKDYAAFVDEFMNQ